MPSYGAASCRSLRATDTRSSTPLRRAFSRAAQPRPGRCPGRRPARHRAWRRQSPGCPSRYPIQHALTRPHLQFQRLQAEPGGRVLAGPERHPGVEFEDAVAVFRRERLPAGLHDQVAAHPERSIERFPRGGPGLLAEREHRGAAATWMAWSRRSAAAAPGPRGRHRHGRPRADSRARPRGRPATPLQRSPPRCPPPTAPPPPAPPPDRRPPPTPTSRALWEQASRVRAARPARRTGPVHSPTASRIP